MIVIAILALAMLIAGRIVADDAPPRRASVPATESLPPKADPDSVTLAATGDLGSSATELAPVAEQIQGLAPEYVLALGDLVYPDGQPSGFTGFFAETWGPFLQRVIAAPGNHDYHTPDARGFYHTFPQPRFSLETSVAAAGVCMSSTVRSTAARGPGIEVRER